MLDRVCRMVEVYCGGFHNLTRELIESSSSGASGSGAGGGGGGGAGRGGNTPSSSGISSTRGTASSSTMVDATVPLLQKVWTVFVEQCEDRFRNEHGNQLAEYLRDAEEIKKNLAESLVRAGAEVARSDAINSLANSHLQRAKVALSTEMQRAAAAEASAAEAERLRLATRLEAR